MRNIFAVGFILICIVGHPSAHAGFMSCMRSLMSEAAPETPLTKAYADYDRFLKIRRANPSVIPPALQATKETTAEEKFFGFGYWWLPINVWHTVMTSQYSGMHMLREFKRSGQKVPLMSEMPEVARNDSSLNVPQVLPELPPGRLSYRFKRNQRREFQNYQRAREKDQHLLPPVTVATEDTPPEEIYFGFRFWWFPQNIWHDEVAPHHGEFAKRILETHIRDGFVFPEPPHFLPDREFELPATEDEQDLQLRTPMQISPMLGVSPEAASLNHAATEIDSSDSGGPNTSDSGPGAGPGGSP